MGEAAASLRYCRRCKLAFPCGADGMFRCPDGHPNFSYTKTIPENATIVADGSESGAAKPATSVSKSVPASPPPDELEPKDRVPRHEHRNPTHDPEADLGALQTRSLRDQWRAAERADGDERRARYRSNSIERLQQMQRVDTEGARWRARRQRSPPLPGSTAAVRADAASDSDCDEHDELDGDDETECQPLEATDTSEDDGSNGGEVQTQSPNPPLELNRTQSGTSVPRMSATRRTWSGGNPAENVGSACGSRRRQRSGSILQLELDSKTTSELERWQAMNLLGEIEESDVDGDWERTGAGRAVASHTPVAAEKPLEVPEVAESVVGQRHRRERRLGFAAPSSGPARSDMDVGKWCAEVGAGDDLEDAFLVKEIDTLGELADAVSSRQEIDRLVKQCGASEEVIDKLWSEVARINGVATRPPASAAEATGASAAAAADAKAKALVEAEAEAAAVAAADAKAKATEAAAAMAAAAAESQTVADKAMAAAEATAGAEAAAAAEAVQAAEAKAAKRKQTTAVSRVAVSGIARPDMDVGKWCAEVGAGDDLEDAFLVKEIDTLGELADAVSSRQEIDRLVKQCGASEEVIDKLWSEVARINGVATPILEGTEAEVLNLTADSELDVAAEVISEPSELAPLELEVRLHTVVLCGVPPAGLKLRRTSKDRLGLVGVRRGGAAIVRSSPNPTPLHAHKQTTLIIVVQGISWPGVFKTICTGWCVECNMPPTGDGAPGCMWVPSRAI